MPFSVLYINHFDPVFNTVNPAYNNHDVKNHLPEISQLILSKTVFVKQNIPITKCHGTRSEFWPLLDKTTPPLPYIQGEMS